MGIKILDLSFFAVFILYSLIYFNFHIIFFTHRYIPNLLPLKCDICYIYEAVLSHVHDVNSIVSVLNLRPINGSILS